MLHTTGTSLPSRDLTTFARLTGVTASSNGGSRGSLSTRRELLVVFSSLSKTSLNDVFSPPHARSPPPVSPSPAPTSGLTPGMAKVSSRRTRLRRKSVRRLLLTLLRLRSLMNAHHRGRRPPFRFRDLLHLLLHLLLRLGGPRRCPLHGRRLKGQIAEPAQAARGQVHCLESERSTVAQDGPEKHVDLR